MGTGNNLHTTHLYRDRLPQGGKNFQNFSVFSRAAGPQIKGIWPRGRYGLVRHVFLSSGSYWGPREREKHEFPSRFRNQNFLHIFPKFWTAFWIFYPPKRPNLAPGPSPSCFPCFFTPGDLWRARETLVRPRFAWIGPGQSSCVFDILNFGRVIIPNAHVSREEG